MVFPETHWTHIAAASLDGVAAARIALESLCNAYYMPLRHFIAWKYPNGIKTLGVDDLTQGFFVHLMNHEVWKRANRERGRFRSLLLGTLRHYLATTYRTKTRLQPGEHLAIGEFSEMANLTSEMEPEIQEFDRRWAVAVMTAAMDRIAEEVKESRGVENWEVLKCFLSSNSPAPPYQTAATALGLTLGTLKMEILRSRRRLGECVRLEVARTVAEPHEVDDEIRYLRKLLTHHG